MPYSKLFSTQIPSEQIDDDINKAITKIYALSADEYNSNVFHDIAIGFKSIVYNMEKGESSAFPLFLKWLKLYVRLQHQIDPQNKQKNKFEKKIPVCTSYIVASLQYQTKMANYHLQAMEMCLSLFDSASTNIMKIIANFEMEIIALLWMPIEFVGDYNTQKVSLKLITKVLKHLNESDRRKKVAEIDRSEDLRNLLLRLTVEDVNFEKISRELLNTFNMRITQNCGVFSVHSTTVLFGSFELFKPENADKFWIDFNYASKSVSFLCQLKQSNGDRQELSIQIKIDKLQIDNQFDCIVISIEPAIFTIDVIPELRNARIAVFTLPQNEVERLKENRDLLDFYNKSDSYLESDIPPTPNTIENYLAENDSSEILCSQDSLEPSGVNMLPKVTFTTVFKKDKPKPAISENTTTKPYLNKTVDQRPTANNTSSSKAATSLKELPNNNSFLTRESGYNTGVSPIKEDATIFKKPVNPVPRKTTSKSLTNNRKSLTKPPKKPCTPPKLGNGDQSSSQLIPLSGKSSRQPQKPNTPPRLENRNQPASQMIPPISGKSSRRFFKTKPTKIESPPPKKPKRTYRKRQATVSNTEISPKQKQVNTVKPLNHLTKPDFDPEEATLEYVENGGHTNIIKFLSSNLGARCFNEQQRQQIIENVKRINQDLERNAQRFLPKDASTDTDGSLICKPTVKRRKGKAAPIIEKMPNFVPYSTWKKQQKEKTNGQSTLVENKLEQKNQQAAKISMNAFDQIKTSGTTCSKSSTSQRKTTKSATVIHDNRSCRSSVSSCSNHNFHIPESDNELIEVSSDEEILSVDMVCRREPEERELSPVPVPIEISQNNKSNRSRQTCSPFSQVSMPSDDFDVVDSSQNPVDPTWIIPSATAQRRNSYQMSEIFEDPDVIPPSGLSQNKNQSNLSSNFASEISPTQSHQSLTSQIPYDVHTESDRNQDQTNDWFLSRYLNYQPPFRLNDSPSCIDSTPNEQSSSQRLLKVTTHQVIIQNQIVLSTVRKRPNADRFEESAMAKTPRYGDNVSLRGSGHIFASYMEKVTKEKDRLLNELERKLQTDFYENFNEIVDEVMKSMEEHEAAINEAQEQLSFIFGKLEWLIENHQKKKIQLESIYCQLIGRIRASMPRKEEIHRAYEEVAERLKKYSTTLSGELWQNFANDVVNSIEDRLMGLIHL